MRSSVIISALVAVVIGFGSSVAIILAAAQSAGASPAQTSSWVAMLCIALAGISAVLSIGYRMPIVAAWSTPGAALIAGSTGLTIETAVGAFYLAAALVLVTALLRPLGRLIERIPSSVASAMLAGVIFSFVVALFDHIPELPELVLPLLLVFLVARLFSPTWAVLAVLVLGCLLAWALGLTSAVGPVGLSQVTWIAPRFDAGVLLGVGVPLYLVTMASQNLPGLAVLRAAGYQPPTRPLLAVTGAASLLTAGFGAHTTNLAAITASLCTGPDAHPDKDKRWLCGPVYALGYVGLALVGASVVTLFASLPTALVITIAGIALSGPFVAALGAALSSERERFAAAVTFLVTASGLTVLGVGSAFWGLLAGLAVLGLERFRPRGS